MIRRLMCRVGLHNYHMRFITDSGITSRLTLLCGRCGRRG